MGAAGDGSPRINRVAHRRGDAMWLADAWTRARILIIDADATLTLHNALAFVTAAQAPTGERLFLGVDEHDTPYFALAADLPDIPGATRGTVRDIAHLLTPRDRDLLVTAVALAHWHTAHGYSPRSGALTVPRDGGWARETLSGDTARTARAEPTLLWPRTDPAVIVLIHNGVSGDEGRCLLARNAAWPQPRYSCLAGFVEPGESAEAAVEREVTEEVGLTLRRLRYSGSQPWPYPGQLMLGFTAEASPEQPLTLDAHEISDARWFTRRELRSDPPLLPKPSSIARHLIDTWLSTTPPAPDGL